MKFLGKLIVGVFASIGFFIVVLTVAGVYFVMKADNLGPAAPKPPEKIVLQLDLDEGFVEGASGRRLEGFMLQHRTTLQDALIAIRRAKDDPRVVGIVANLTEQSLGLAQIQDVRDVMTEFKASGKPSLLYAETIGEGTGATPTYYLASAFNEVWVQPSGTVGLAGIGIEQPFFKAFLDRFGVKANVIQRKEYKSAMENVTNERISPANKEALQALLGSFFDQIVTGVAKDRSLEAAAVRRAIDNGPLLAQEALEAKLIDHLGYRDEFEAELDKRLPDAQPVEINKYLSFPSSPARPEPKKRVAVIHAVGEIMRGRDDNDPFGSDDRVLSDTMAEAVADAAGNDEIDAILLRIDSPGGSYVASDTIWRELVLAKAKKPIIVSMGNTAASGGYFLAMPADRIFAQPATITGSIGVIMGKLVFGGAFDKLDINWERISFGETAGMFSSTTEFSPKELARLNEMIDAAYADFTTKAAKGRNKDVAELERNARGRVWTGADALKAGLVDELGGFGRAIDYTKEKLGLVPGDTVWLVPYPAPEDPWKKLLRAFEDGGLPFGLMSGLKSLNLLATELAPVTEAGKLMNRRGVQLYADPIAVN
ncbi:MAG: signal peptide peptidase SppA [Rhodospirillaceae bacterium]|nr:signal peptide peptidase SppA [Rhodospirillaceae bacterium]